MQGIRLSSLRCGLHEGSDRNGSELLPYRLGGLGFAPGLGDPHLLYLEIRCIRFAPLSPVKVRWVDMATILEQLQGRKELREKPTTCHWKWTYYRLSTRRWSYTRCHRSPPLDTFESHQRRRQQTPREFGSAGDSVVGETPLQYPASHGCRSRLPHPLHPLCCRDNDHHCCQALSRTSFSK